MGSLLRARTLSKKLATARVSTAAACAGERAAPWPERICVGYRGEVISRVRRKRRAQRSGARLWLVPMAILGGIALIVFASVYLLDHEVTGGRSSGDPDSALARYVRFE